MKQIRKAVIPAAGFGTRFLPFTKAVPKEMLPIVDIPTIEYIVQEAIDSGIEEVLIIINSEKECIYSLKYIDNFHISPETWFCSLYPLILVNYHSSNKTK